jgi:hypothetical protein
MITHIVFMKFKDRSPEIPQTVKDKLLTLPAKIPQIKHFEVGLDVMHSERSYDVALFSKFDSLDDLKIYNTHPDHVEVLGYIRSVLDVAASVDYES